MLNLIDPERYFERHIIILLFFSLIDGVALFYALDLPIGIIYGPLIYSAYKSAVGDRVPLGYLHIFPFLIFLFTYILFHLGAQFSINWVFYLLRYYNVVYAIALPVSLLIYSAIVVLSEWDKKIERFDIKMIRRVCFANIIYALFMALFVIKIIWTDVNFGFNPNLIAYIYIGGVIFIMSYYLLFTTKKSSGLIVNNEPNKEPYHIDINVSEFKAKLEECLEQSQLFLNASLTLDMLAYRADLPKHHLSYYLNTYMGKSFYQLIAAYRIEYAKKRLNEDDSITIESLAYECGFNSKTTLNKYFKELTGFVPSQYRSHIISKQLSLK